MMLIAVLCLIAKLTSVSGSCVGDPSQYVDDLDWPAFADDNPWYYAFHSVGATDSIYTCPVATFGSPQGTQSAITIKGRMLESLPENVQGTAYNWNSNSWLQSFPNNTNLNGQFLVIEANYNEFFINQYCYDNTIMFPNNQPYYIVGFRSWPPTPNAMQDMQQALVNHGIAFISLVPWCQ